MRAVYPDQVGTVERGGVDIAYEVYEGDGPTLFLIPPSPITHSRIFKGQIPFLSRHFRLVAIDGRGNGNSGRPTEAAAHSRAENAADILAVMDATGTDRAILVAHCHANWWAVEIAAAEPGRVTALVAIEPGVPYLGRPQPHWVETAGNWEEILEDPKGWDLFNRHTIVNRHRDWVEFFFGEQLVEPHSTKQWDDAVSWAIESTGEILAAGEEGAEIDPPTKEEFEELCRSLDLPVLVIHGEKDVCQHVDRGRAFAEITGADLVIMEGSGHLTLARDPVRVNRAIKEFVDRVSARTEVTT